MTSSLYLRDLIKNALMCGAKNYSVYPNNAPDSASFPYIVFRTTDFGRMLESCVHEGEIDIDLWDNYETYSRIESMIDDIDEALEDIIIEDAHVQCRVYPGTHRIVEDSDKAIKHIEANAQIRFTKKGE